MGKKVRQFFKIVDSATEKVGSTLSLITLCIVLLIVFEVTARYVFNSPTDWAWPIIKQLFGVITLFAGGYALLHGRHIRIEIFYERFNSRMKVVSNVLTLIFFLLFIGVLIWQGYVMAKLSFSSGEHITGIFQLPLYPLRMVIPVAALLFLLQGMASFFLRKGVNEPSVTE